MFNNFLAIVTGSLFGKPEAAGTTQSEESPAIAVDGADTAQGFLPILMQLLPNPMPVQVSAEGNGTAGFGIGEENTAITSASLPEVSGTTSPASGVMRFLAATAFSPPMEQEEGQLLTGSTEIVKLPETRKLNVPQQLSSLGSHDEEPAPTRETTVSEPVEVRQPGAAGKANSSIVQADKHPKQILDGMTTVPEHIPEAARTTPSSRETTGIEHQHMEKSVAPPKSASHGTTPLAQSLNPRDVASLNRPTGSDTSEVKEKSPDATHKQVTDIGERPKEAGSVHPEARPVRQALPPQEIQIPDSPSRSRSGESGQSHGQPEGDPPSAQQKPDVQTVQSPDQQLATDETNLSSFLRSDTHDGTTAPQAVVAPKGETAHAVSQHPAAHSVQTRTPDVTATGSPALQQTPALPADITRSVIDQVARELARRIGDQGSEIKLMLRPETLGELALKVKLENGAMTAQIDVTQAGVKAALESNLADLRMALQSKGIEVRSIDIFSQSEMASNAGGQTQSRSHSNGRRRYTFESSERYQSSRQLGYNTIEIII